MLEKNKPRPIRAAPSTQYLVLIEYRYYSNFYCPLAISLLSKSKNVSGSIHLEYFPHEASTVVSICMHVILTGSSQEVQTYI